MNHIESLFGNRFSTMRPATLLKFSHLDARVQRHLWRVYATLTVALVISACGAAVDIAWGLGGILTTVGAFGALTALAWTRPAAANLRQRYSMLGLFAFCQGCSLGPLIEAALGMSTGVVFTAFTSTAAVFICFSLAALITTRRSYLYVGGYVASALSMLAIMRLGSFFFGGSALVYNTELYVGLLAFVGYVLFDTQMIVEKASAGDMDHVQHALDLLIDVFAIFVRVLIILMKNADRKRREEEERQRTRR